MCCFYKYKLVFLTCLQQIRFAAEYLQRKAKPEKSCFLEYCIFTSKRSKICTCILYICACTLRTNLCQKKMSTPSRIVATQRETTLQFSAKCKPNKTHVCLVFNHQHKPPQIWNEKCEI